MRHQLIELFTVGVPAFITALGGWIVGSRNDGTSRENVYAQHTQEMWDRMDELSEKLERVTQERDDLKGQVQAMRLQITTLQESIDKLLEEKNE